MKAYGAGNALKKIRDRDLLITENYTASGYVENKIAKKISQYVLSQLNHTKQELIAEKKKLIASNTTILDKIKVNFFGYPPKTIPFPQEDILNQLEELTNQNSDFIWALKSLEDYCMANNTGFIEATEIIVPMIDEWRANPDNLRERFSSR